MTQSTPPVPDIAPARGLAGCGLVLLALFAAATTARPEIAADYLRLQDRWLLLAQAGLWAMVLATAVVWRRRRPLSLPHWAPVAIAVGLAALCWAGHHWLLLGHALSRDEQMAVFDARIYAAGRWAWPLPPAWRADARALNLLFMLPIGRPVAWVSGYLPGNAVLQAVFGTLAGPLLVAVSVLAFWGCARRLFAADREAAVVALILFVLSGQMVMAGMTAFAMPAHLAFNLVWLWLFLRDTRRADVAALVVGFVAIGLHQPLFHPMFVAPWLAVMAWDRRWRRLALFCGAYGVMGLFWLWWPHITLGLVKGPDSIFVDVGSDYLSRLVDTVTHNAQNGPIMAANLVRLADWSHLALWPLVALGALVAGRDRRAAALLGGLGLTVGVMAILLPFQGHGFGYRYLHGLLGNAALLGGFGWARLGADARERWRGGFVAASLATALVLMPLQAWLTHRMYAPFAHVSARIDASGADYVMIGVDDAPLSLDLVINRPDLSNRPIRLSANDIDNIDRLAAHICHDGATIALPADGLYAEIDRAFGTAPTGEAGKRIAPDRDEFEDAGCRVIVLG